VAQNAGPYTILFFKWLAASGLGGFLVIRSLHAMLDRDVETWQGLLGISTGVVLTVTAVSLATSPWYFPIVMFTALAATIAQTAGSVANRIRERQMLEEDAERFRAGIEFDEKNAAAHAFLAAVYRKQGRLKEAVAEYEIALALDPNDGASRANLKALAEQLQAREIVVRCPRCDTLLDAGRKSCPQCGWSRSTVQGLRELYTKGDLKRALIYSVLVTAGIGIYSLVFRVSLQLSLTVLLAGWLACVVLFFYWVVREVL
jgi:tetratricopeptide (TPR) repeat protein